MTSAFPSHSLISRNSEALICPFTTFPREITVEIAKELDWYSLLNFRRTCTLLDAVSRLRDVWISQYHQQAEQSICSARLEEPLDSYSAQELERWVLLRRSCDVGWKREDTKTRTRWVSQDCIESSCLVPGGRWLLIGSLEGSLTAYDLDAATITGRSLTPDSPFHIRYIAIDVDSPKESPNLTFTVALSAIMSRASRFKINIWRVTLTGHGTEARLTAEHLYSVTDHDATFIRGIAIRRNLVARNHVRAACVYIEVLDWTRSTSSSHYKAIIFLDTQILSFRLLPGDRLLACSKEHAMIYKLNIVEMGVHLPGAPNITEPLWKLPFPAGPEFCSPLSQGFSNETATYFVVKAKHFYRLVIPHNEYQTPHLSSLMDGEVNSGRDVAYAVGFQKAFYMKTDGSATRFSFPWELGAAEGVGSSPARNCGKVVAWDHPTECVGALRPQLDEETGRIVQGLKHGFWVADTALVYDG